jgi:hypothetical protein
MEMQEGAKSLAKLLDPYDWFYDVLAEKHRYVVYVHRMEKEQDDIIPDRVLGHQVVVHFADALLASKDKYLVPARTNSLPLYQETLEQVEDIDLPSDVVVPDTSALTRELDRLEKICGTHILGDIFFETHDRKNAVTNLSSRFPEVSHSMFQLYQKYGFDAIYDQLEL